MHRSLKLAVAFSIWAGVAQADAFTDAIVTNLQDLGYGFIEIQSGISQVKVEATRGTDKLEVIYDRATGAILKQENEPAEAEDIGRSGVKIRNRDRDFLRDSDDDDRDDDDDDNSESGSSNSGSGSNDDRGDDDDDNSGSGSSNSGSGSSDDRDDDDDNSGSGSSSSGSGSGDDD